MKIPNRVRSWHTECLQNSLFYSQIPEITKNHFVLINDCSHCFPTLIWSSSSASSSWNISCLWLFLHQYIFHHNQSIWDPNRHNSVFSIFGMAIIFIINAMLVIIILIQRALVKPGQSLVTCLCQGPKGLRWAGPIPPQAKKATIDRPSLHLPLYGSAPSEQKCKSKVLYLERGALRGKN